jgi:hypothetical protein
VRTAACCTTTHAIHHRIRTCQLGLMTEELPVSTGPDPELPVATGRYRAARSGRRTTVGRLLPNSTPGEHLHQSVGELDILIKGPHPDPFVTSVGAAAC